MLGLPVVGVTQCGVAKRTESNFGRYAASELWRTRQTQVRERAMRNGFRTARELNLLLEAQAVLSRAAACGRLLEPNHATEERNGANQATAVNQLKIAAVSHTNRVLLGILVAATRFNAAPAS